MAYYRNSVEYLNGIIIGGHPLESMAQGGKPSSFLSGTFDCYVWPPKIIYILWDWEYHTEINNRISVSCFSTWLGRVCFCWMVVTTTPKKVTFWKEIASWCHQTWFARKSSMILSARSLHLVWVFPIARLITRGPQEPSDPVLIFGLSCWLPIDPSQTMWNNFWQTAKIWCWQNWVHCWLWFWSSS